jgi:hypothetical protein
MCVIGKLENPEINEANDTIWPGYPSTPLMSSPEKLPTIDPKFGGLWPINDAKFRTPVMFVEPVTASILLATHTRVRIISDSINAERKSLPLMSDMCNVEMYEGVYIYHAEKNENNVV